MKIDRNQLVAARWASPNTTARVMVAVLNGARSTDDIAAAAGRSKSVTHKVLHALRDEGLIDFTNNQQGTIHATVAIVDVKGL